MSQEVAFTRSAGLACHKRYISPPRFVDHHFPPEIPPGPAVIRKFFTEFSAGIFSDVRIEIDFLPAEGDKVDCHFVVYAGHTGDGKPAEAWEIYDSGSMARQMQAEEQ